MAKKKEDFNFLEARFGDMPVYGESDFSSVLKDDEEQSHVASPEKDGDWNIDPVALAKEMEKEQAGGGMEESDNSPAKKSRTKKQSSLRQNKIDRFDPELNLLWGFDRAITKSTKRDFLMKAVVEYIKRHYPEKYKIYVEYMKLSTGNPAK